LPVPFVLAGSRFFCVVFVVLLVPCWFIGRILLLFQQYISLLEMALILIYLAVQKNNDNFLFIFFFSFQIPNAVALNKITTSTLNKLIWEVLMIHGNEIILVV